MEPSGDSSRRPAAAERIADNVAHEAEELDAAPCELVRKHSRVAGVMLAREFPDSARTTPLEPFVMAQVRLALAHLHCTRPDAAEVDEDHFDRRSDVGRGSG